MGIFQRAVKPYLPNGDYLSVAMPTDAVKVGQVLTREGGVVRRYSTLETVFVVPKGTPAPSMLAEQSVAADASGKAQRSTQATLGLTLVGSIIQALGGQPPGATLSASAARTVEYGFSDITEYLVDVGSLDQWLAGADVDPRSHAVVDLLYADDLYVVVGVLKAKALTVSLLDETSKGITLKVPEIQAAVGAEVDLTTTSSTATTLMFKSRTMALTIGAKVAQIQVDEAGFFVNERVLREGEVRGLGTPRTKTLYLTDPAGLRPPD
jgi:hypothetical protein